MNTITSLFLAANPLNTSSLRLDQEIREIHDKIRDAEYRDSLNLAAAWAARPDDLIQYLNQHKPQIVHFSGHGTLAGEIVLCDQNGDLQLVTAEAMSTLFRTIKDNIRLVILNACYSKNQATLLTDTIDCVIGMNDEIDDTAATIFVASLYRAIGFGRSIQDAFEQGKLALILQGVPGAEKAELLTKRGVDPNQIFLIRSPEPQPELKKNLKQMSDHQGAYGQATRVKFRNRVKEIREICNPHSSPFIVIDAPAGYGKTALLQEVQQRYEADGWLTALIDLSEFRNQTSIRNQIMRQLNGTSIRTTEPKEADGQLIRQISRARKTLILFDAVEKSEEELVDWLQKLVLRCKGNSPMLEFRTIFSGQYITAGKKKLRWQKFRHHAQFLGPFSQKIVEELLEDMVQIEKQSVDTFSSGYREGYGDRYEDPYREYSNAGYGGNESSSYALWAEQITRLSCGHPKGITRIVDSLRTDWELPFSELDDQKYLFETCIADVLDQAIDILDARTKADFESLSIFRYFNLSTIQALTQRGELIKSKNPLQLLGDLSVIARQSNDNHGLYSDTIVRKLLLTRMKLFYPDRFYYLNQVASEIYEEWINEALQMAEASPAGLGYVNPLRIAELCAYEGLYHAAQQIPTHSGAKTLTQSLHKASQVLTRVLGEDEFDPGHQSHIERFMWTDEDIQAVLKENQISKIFF